MSKKHVLFLFFSILFGCSEGNKQQVTPVLNQNQTPVPEMAVSEPPLNGKDSVYEKKDWIVEIQKLGERPTDEEYESFAQQIKDADLSDQNESDLKNIANSFYLIENPQREKVFISCALNHQNKTFRETCTLKLIEVNQSVILAQELIKQNQIFSLYRERYVDGVNVKATLDQEIEKFIYYVDLFLNTGSSTAAILLCSKVLEWQHLVFHEILRPKLRNEEREEIFKDIVKTGEVIVRVLSSDERAHSYLAASYYSLAKLCSQGGTLQYTYINEAIQIAERLVGLIRTQPKNINLASLYFEKAKIYAHELPIHAYQVFFDTVRALDQNPNRKDIHDFLVRRVLSREAGMHFDFVYLMQQALELYPRTVPYLALDLAHYYLNQMSFFDTAATSPDPLETTRHYLNVFESSLATSDMHESLKSELRGHAYLLQANIIQIGHALVKNYETLYFHPSVVNNEVQNMYDLIFQAIAQFQNAGKIIEQPREPFSFLFEPEFSDKNWATARSFVSPLELPELKDHIISYAEHAQSERRRVDPLTQVVEIGLDLGGRELYFNSGAYVLKSPLVIDLGGQSLMCDMGSVIDTQGFDLTIKNAASVEGCVFLSMSQYVIEEIPETAAPGEDWRLLDGHNVSAPTTPSQAQTGLTGKSGAQFKIETQAIRNFDIEKPFYRKQTVIISKGGPGGRGAQGGLGGDGVEYFYYQFDDKQDPRGFVDTTMSERKGRVSERSFESAQGGRGGQGGKGGPGGEIVFVTENKADLYSLKHTLSLFTLGGQGGEPGEGGLGGCLDQHGVVGALEHGVRRFKSDDYVPYYTCGGIICSHYVWAEKTREGSERLGTTGARGQVGLAGDSGKVRVLNK